MLPLIPVVSELQIAFTIHKNSEELTQMFVAGQAFHRGQNFLVP